MSGKKRPGDNLTGGTHDVNPQILNVAVTTTGANTFTQASIVLPQNKFQNAKNSAIVIEVLKVIYNMPAADANHTAGGNLISSTTQLATRSQTGIVLNDPTVQFYGQREQFGAFTAAGSYTNSYVDPIMIDYTDGAGHGVLVATDQLFMGVNTSGFAGTAAFGVKMLYRFKEISLAEYIGIVQSQS